MVRKCRAGNFVKISDTQGLDGAEHDRYPPVLSCKATAIVFEASRNEKRKVLFISIH